MILTLICLAEAAVVLLFIFSYELWYFLIAVGLCLLAMGVGVTTFLVALRLKSVKYKWREKVFVLLGIIGGWVWFGISLIIIYQALLNL